MRRRRAPGTTRGTYIPVAIGTDAGPVVEEFIRTQLEVYLRDIHTMLRLPKPRRGLHAGCNFAIAAVLLNLIAGLGTVFRCGKKGDPRYRFISLLRDYYPWADEPGQGVREANRAANVLYDLFRNPFAHSIGLDTEIIGGDRRHKAIRLRARERPLRLGVSRVNVDGAVGLSRRRARELEMAGTRPNWLPPTLHSADGNYALSCEALYRGFRHLILAATSDVDALRRAAAFLEGR